MENMNGTGRSAKERNKPGDKVYANEPLDDEEYLTTDLLEDEQSETRVKSIAQANLTYTNTQHDTTNVLHDEELITWVDNSVCNTDITPDDLPPEQSKPVTAKTDNIVDQKRKIEPLPALPADRTYGEHKYEEIPEIPQYLELEDIATPAAEQTSPMSNRATSPTTRDTDSRKLIVMGVTIGVLLGIITVGLALFITYLDPNQNEDGVNFQNTTQSKGKFTEPVYFKHHWHNHDNCKVQATQYHGTSVQYRQARLNIYFQDSCILCDVIMCDPIIILT